MHATFKWKNVKERNNFVDLVVDRWLILKWTLKK